MSRPTVSDTAERIYDQLAPYRLGDPEEPQWLLLHLCEALAITLRKPTDLLRADDRGSGWRRALDPDRAPAWLLPWLAQWVGVEDVVGLSEADQRIRIRDVAGFRRGTLGALIAAGQSTLTGGKHVNVLERLDGHAYRIGVFTYTSETPNAAATLAALTAQKDAGLVLVYAAYTGWVIGVMEDDPDHPTIGDLEDDFATIADLEDHIP